MLMLTASTGWSSPADKNLRKTRETLPAEKQTLSGWKHTLTSSRWWWQASWSLFYCHLGEPRGCPRVQPCFHWSQLWPLTRRRFFFVVFISGSSQAPPAGLEGKNQNQLFRGYWCLLLVKTPRPVFFYLTNILKQTWFHPWRTIFSPQSPF